MLTLMMKLTVLTGMLVFIFLYAGGPEIVGKLALLTHVLHNGG